MWVVVVLASLAAAACAYRLLRNVRSRYLRVLLPAAWLGLTLAPAPVPGFAGNLAPAFVVFAFEALFQASGEPWVAGRLALAGVAVAVALGLLGLLIWQRLRAPATVDSKASDQAAAPATTNSKASDQAAAPATTNSKASDQAAAPSPSTIKED